MDKLAKLFSPNKLKLARSSATQPPPMPAEEPQLLPLRIVHAGGAVESYYMALPAARIMEKHPRSLVLARPEVFRRPWQSLVRPDEILAPGQKFYLLPRATVRKLQLRTRRPSSLRGPSVSREEDRDGETENNEGSTPPPPPHLPLGRKRVQFVDTWQPSLVAIQESSPLMF